MTVLARISRPSRSVMMPSSAPAARDRRQVWSTDLYRSGLAGDDELARCLSPLLDALGWEGDPREVAEALPHMAEQMSIGQFRDVMALLGYDSILMPRLRCDRIDRQLLPALVLADDGRFLVICKPDAEGRTIVRNPARGTEGLDDLQRLRGKVCVFKARNGPSAAEQAASAGRWSVRLLQEFQGPLLRAAAIGAAASLMGLAAVLCVMLAVDASLLSVSQAPSLILSLAVVAAIMTEGLLRYLGARMLYRIADQLSAKAATDVFRHLLTQPLSAADRLRSGAKLQSLDMAERLQHAVSGPSISRILALPISTLSIGMIAVLGGWIALVPVACVVGLCAAAFLLLPALTRASEGTARVMLERQDFLCEAALRHEHILLSASRQRWRSRFREISGRASFARFDLEMWSARAGAGAQAAVLTAVAVVVALGALKVIEDTLSPGAFVAIVLLTWWTLSLFQAAFAALTDLVDLRRALADVDLALTAPAEEDARARHKDVSPVRVGQLSFARLSSRHAPDLEPILPGLNADIAAGEIVALAGPNGAGKSNLLKMVLGLYQPQGGSILIDGVDIRQHPAISLRQVIGFVPQDFELFYGTIRQNLLLAMPTATEAEMEQAARRAGVHDAIMAWPDGYDHRVGDAQSRLVPASVKNGLALAAAYLRAPRLLLLDEAIDNLDEAMTEALYAELERLRGQTTVLMVTHRPSTMRRADRLFVIQDGRIVRRGLPSELLD